jgi:Histidine kinase-, DNA gyrase B-, and HSP90-like ATPase
MTSQAVSTFADPRGVAVTKRPVTEDVLIGKDILELITDAMYIDPLSIYREYIQNACDSIDCGTQTHLYGADVEPRIDIHVDLLGRGIRIRDNGVGLPRDAFVRTLTAIGGSSKRGKELRGFRGVGRLAGLGYCQELIFRARSGGDRRISEITWDGRRLKDLLRRADYCGDLSDAVRAIAEVSTKEAEGFPAHFFEVELKRVTRLKNDVLLNVDEVRAYLSQVAPVPFDPGFSYGADLESILAKHSANSSYVICLNDSKGQVYRPFADRFSISDKAEDRFQLVQPVTLFDSDGEPGAVGWILHHSYLGALPKRAQISGIRLRSGNIQVGSPDLLAGLFPEPRFNSWCVGEIHILHKKVLPNGRRDDFEPNVHYHHIQGQLAPIVRQLAKACRDRSTLRNRLKRSSDLLKSARDALELLSSGEPPPFVTRFVERRLKLTLEEVQQILNENSAFQGERLQIEKQCKKLQVEFERLNPGRVRRISVRGIASAKRAAQEEVLELIYELSTSPTEAHQLASRIVEKLGARTA